MRHPRRLAWILALLWPGAPGVGQEPPAPARAPPSPEFVFPCDGYLQGLRGSGNFGVRVAARGSPFEGTWHLAEDVWLPPGTEVRAIQDGVVRYSAFSPTWTDARGGVHWNLGNVVVIEHPLGPAGGELESVCSFSVHLAADRRVAVGDRVQRGQVIGRIGADRSEENGRYPAHLHFGIHRGPYVQLWPSLERELRGAAASEAGLRIGDQILRGELDLVITGSTDLLLTATATGDKVILSLRVGSTAPTDPPPDIMGWCQGYGEKEAVAEWIRPSAFLQARQAR